MNKNILFVSYVFPPTGGAGIQRTVKLVKYFSRLGWRPFVLTVKNPSVPVYDEQFIKDIPNDVVVYKSLSFEVPYAIKKKIWQKTKQTNGDQQNEAESDKNPSLLSWLKSKLSSFIQFIMLPDPQIGWVWSARRTCRKIIKKHQIGTVFISAPPFSSLLIGLKLGLPEVKIISDFRDEWTEFYLKTYDFHKRENSTSLKINRMENEVLENSSLITMATDSFVINYKNKYPSYQHKIKVLTNGYDPDDFAAAKHNPELKQNDKFIICYTGTIFNVTTVKYFLNALDQLFDNNPNLKDKVEVRFVGRITEDEQIYFNMCKYRDSIKCVGYVNHDESISYLINSDLLLVIVDDLDGSERIIAAKVFEYIKTGIPILGLVPENGEVAKIIEQTNSGIVISNRKTEQISKLLAQFIHRDFHFTPDEEEIKKFSRDNIANQLIKYINGLG